MKNTKGGIEMEMEMKMEICRKLLSLDRLALQSEVDDRIDRRNSIAQSFHC